MRDLIVLAALTAQRGDLPLAQQLRPDLYTLDETLALVRGEALRLISKLAAKHRPVAHARLPYLMHVARLTALGTDFASAAEYAEAVKSFDAPQPRDPRPQAGRNNTFVVRGLILAHLPVNNANKARTRRRRMHIKRRQANAPAQTRAVASRPGQQRLRLPSEPRLVPGPGPGPAPIRKFSVADNEAKQVKRIRNAERRARRGIEAAASAVEVASTPALRRREAAARRALAQQQEARQQVDEALQRHGLAAPADLAPAVAEPELDPEVAAAALAAEAVAEALRAVRDLGDAYDEGMDDGDHDPGPAADAAPDRPSFRTFPVSHQFPPPLPPGAVPANGKITSVDQLFAGGGRSEATRIATGVTALHRDEASARFRILRLAFEARAAVGPVGTKIVFEFLRVFALNYFATTTSEQGETWLFNPLAPSTDRSGCNGFLKRVFSLLRDRSADLVPTLGVTIQRESFIDTIVAASPSLAAHRDEVRRMPDQTLLALLNGRYAPATTNLGIVEQRPTPYDLITTSIHELRALAHVHRLGLAPMATHAGFSEINEALAWQLAANWRTMAVRKFIPALEAFVGVHVGRVLDNRKAWCDDPH